jgi:filamentous hemagglutinin
MSLVNTISKAISTSVFISAVIASSSLAVDDVTLTSIANGHAYDKHVVEKKEFPEVKTKGQFLTLIKGVANSPANTKNLERGRTAYWGDNNRTIVIVDPSHIDKGTAFRPTDKKPFSTD